MTGSPTPPPSDTPQPGPAAPANHGAARGLARYVRLGLGALVVAAAVFTLAISGMAGAAAGRQASVGVVLSALCLGTGGVLLLMKSWAGWWVLALWLLVPLQNAVRLAWSEEGHPSLVMLGVIAIIGAALVVVRRDLSAPAPVRPARSLQVVAASFVLLLAVTELVSVMWISRGLTPGQDRELVWGRALQGLLLQRSVRYIAEKAHSEAVRAAALRRVSDPRTRLRLAAADSTRRAVRSQRFQAVMAENARIRSLESPLAGTYRFEIALDGTQPATVFGRSELHPSGAINRELDARGFGEPSTYWEEAGARAVAYSLHLTLTRTLDSLPMRTELEPGRIEWAYAYVTELPTSSGSDPAVYAVQTTIVPGAFRLLRRQPPFNERWRSTSIGRTLELSAPIRREVGEAHVFADGRVVIETRILRGDAVVASVRGTRVSRDVAEPR